LSGQPGDMPTAPGAAKAAAPPRRAGGRGWDQLRPLVLTPGYLDFAEGSCLVSWGRTRVLCAATVAEQVPPFRLGSGGGWVTAEYAMLPRATHSRMERESLKGRVGGRTSEISRLIGRALRAGVDLSALGPRTLILDCDVLQADGGTRTAAITGAFVALCLALERLRQRGFLLSSPIRHQIAAVSLGLVHGHLLLDLDYEEDSQAAVDANFVATGQGELIEVQLTGEAGPFPPGELNRMQSLAFKGVREITRLQEEALAPCLPLNW
jgi:ribonuclease PH